MGKSYSQKLKDPKWQKKRLEVLKRDDWECQVCTDTKTTLHVHHKTYQYGRDPWDYPNKNFITLCEECHGKLHEQKKETSWDSLKIKQTEEVDKPSRFGNNPINKRPFYEMEVIRLMITFGNDMVRFVSKNIESCYFSDDNLAHLFRDIVQRTDNGDEISIQYYTDSKNKFKSVVKDILTDKHSVSKRFAKIVGREYRKDKNPVLSVKSSMKPMLLSFCQNKKDEISSKITDAEGDKKKDMAEDLKSLQKEIVRVKKTSSDNLFETPEYLQKEGDVKTKFNYTIKGNTNAKD